MESIDKLRMMLFRRTCPERFERSSFRSFLRKEYLTFDWEAQPIGLQKNCKNSPWIIYTLISPYNVMKAIMNRPQIDPKYECLNECNIVFTSLWWHLRPWDAMGCHGIPRTWPRPISRIPCSALQNLRTLLTQLSHAHSLDSAVWDQRISYKPWHSMTMCLDIPSYVLYI